MPKISQDRIQQHLVDRDLRLSQMAEQLMEVPTVLSPSLLQQQLAEQIVDIPVPRGRGVQAVEVVKVLARMGFSSVFLISLSSCA